MSSASDHTCGFVAILGPPNAGKSTLLNHLVGQKVAIVTPKPQTTRNQITGILSRPGLQMVFLDTPGIHRPLSDMNSLFVHVAWQALEAADAALMVCDAHLAVTKPRAFWAEIELLQARMSNLDIFLGIALNKTDLIRNKNELIPVISSLRSAFPRAEIIPISASTGDNTEHMLQILAQHLPASPALYPEDQLSTLPLRFLCTEILREKLFLSLDRELPYMTAVGIELWNEDPQRALTTIHAVIYVPKQSHKGIIIGKKGSRLKEVGRRARLELEDLLDMQVNLQLWVKIKPGWTEDQPFILQFLPELVSGGPL